MKGIKEKSLGVLICTMVAGVSTLLSGLSIGGFSFEVIGAPVFSIVIGMVITAVFKNLAGSKNMKAGITFTSKKILQYAVIILGFTLNIKTVLSVGGKSLPVIISTIAVSLIMAAIMCKLLKV
ncbi:MAG: putative sulfate exporter family transporter [Eubacterium sp.]|nr:putative sulfate exporter family transporter [Eubacterium sp.]